MNNEINSNNLNTSTILTASSSSDISSHASSSSSGLIPATSLDEGGLSKKIDSQLLLFNKNSKLNSSLNFNSFSNKKVS
jgi:hypothetical protein